MCGAETGSTVRTRGRLCALRALYAYVRRDREFSRTDRVWAAAARAASNRLGILFEDARHTRGTRVKLNGETRAGFFFRCPKGRIRFPRALSLRSAGHFLFGRQAPPLTEQNVLKPLTPPSNAPYVPSSLRKNGFRASCVFCCPSSLAFDSPRLSWGTCGRCPSGILI